MLKKKQVSRYSAIMEKIFLDRYTPGSDCVPFKRIDIETTSQELGIKLPKNLGDVIYSIRYRSSMPSAILETQNDGKEWVIEGAGRSRYEFRLVNINRILPNLNLITTKIPDATPEIIAAHSLSDEQALLAKVRYNRLVDIFLGIAAYSLQNHLRTTVKGVGQIEIDEIYIGIDKDGKQYVIPVQAKSGSDQLSVVQTKQDVACCEQKFKGLICRPISTQFISADLIAVFELALVEDKIKIVSEKHYRLCSHTEIIT